jgi:hypothetical protein
MRKLSRLLIVCLMLASLSLPVFAGNTEEPSVTGNTEEPSITGNTEEPSAEGNTEEPSLWVVVDGLLILFIG